MQVGFDEQAYNVMMPFMHDMDAAQMLNFAIGVEMAIQLNALAPTEWQQSVWQKLDAVIFIAVQKEQDEAKDSLQDMRHDQE